jgi:hypothetical protein
MSTTAPNCQEIARQLMGEPEKKSGNVIFYLCPYHTEKTPSFAVYADGFKCWGCSAHGDTIQLVRDVNRMTFIEALEYLKMDRPAQYHQPKPQTPIFPEYAPPNEVWRENANRHVAKAYAYLKSDLGEPARRYLTEVRKLDPRVIFQCKLGYIPLPPNYPYQIHSETIGVVKVIAGIIIPSYDPNFNLWQVRVRLPKPPAPKIGMMRNPAEAPKYMSWSSVPGEDGKSMGGRLRGSLFMGEYWQPQLPLYLDEGEFNALSVWSAIYGEGYQGDHIIPLALSSTSNWLSREWMERLALAPRVYIRTDAGGSGDRLASELMKISRRIKRVQVPEPYKDPNEFLQAQGLPALMRWIEGFKTL